MLRVRRAKFWMPKYPLSSNLLALLSGSFYGTAGPDKKGRHDVQLDEGSKQEETKKTRKRPPQGGAGRAGTRRKKRGREGGGGVPKWRSKPRDKISLCARTGAHGGPRRPTEAHRGLAQRIPSSRSHISRIPLSYFTRSPPSCSSHSSTLPWRLFEESLIFCYLAFSDPRFPPPFSDAQFSFSTLKNFIRLSIL